MLFTMNAIQNSLYGKFEIQKTEVDADTGDIVIVLGTWLTTFVYIHPVKGVFVVQERGGMDPKTHRTPSMFVPVNPMNIVSTLNQLLYN
jgi:hypothetical protein